MCLILPAFSSPDLKAFPLHLRHCRSSGSAPSLPNLPRAGRCLACFPPSYQQPLSRQLTSRRSQDRRDCVIYSVPHTLLSTNPTDSPRHASRSWPLSFLVWVCARAGKTLISRSNLSASGSCRALRACPLWHLWPVSASASQTRKPSPNTIGPHTFARLSLITSPPSSPARRAFLGFIFSFRTDLIRSFFATYVLKSCRA